MNNIILGFDENKKPCIARSCKVMVLKHFLSVLADSFRGKKYTYRISEHERVPEKSLRLWQSRGFEPSDIGTAYVTFDIVDKEYCYPCYFWDV